MTIASIHTCCLPVAPSSLPSSSSRLRSWFFSSLRRGPRWSCCYYNIKATAAAADGEGIFNCTYSHDHIQQQSSWLDNEMPYLLSMQKRPPCGLVLNRGNWSWAAKETTYYQLRGIMEFHNVTRRNEIFLNEVSGEGVLLSDNSLDQLATSVQVHSKHPGGKPKKRSDGYWPAYIIKAQESTQIEVVININAINGATLSKLQALKLVIKFTTYGPHGLSVELQHVILPLQFPEVQKDNSWERLPNDGAVLPIRTHLLCHMDDPLEIIRRYALCHAKAGDVIAIGETPLAIMQGRFRHPCTIRPSALAKLACRFFHPTSSLATACGMQALIDISGKLKVIFAFILGALARVFNMRGVFYRFAGEQARLIDDVSGTLPPYDQFITLGPLQAQEVVESLQQQTGFGVAIVDVNNLRRVHILAASDKVDQAFLEKALVRNPAGNDDEQTPIVIVRPP